MNPRGLAGLPRLIHRAFEVGVGLKGLDGALEIIGGLLLLTISPPHVSRLILLVTQHELSEDPHDLVAGYLVTLSKGLTAGGQLFGAAYLLTHGITKLALVAALLRRRLWAYPTAIGIFGLFAAYQVYRYTFTHSLYLILLTILDAVVIWLTWLEYTKVKAEAM
jgi:uncharacterized membrane protein